MNEHEIEHLANELMRARRERRTLPALSNSHELTMSDAYAIQDEVTRMRLAAGQHVVGWKLGYTSEAMRTQMGVGAPNFAPLTSAMLLGDPGVIGDDLLQPRVEPEIGIQVGQELCGKVSVQDVARALTRVFSCLEIVDSVFEEYRFRIEDNTADGSSAAQVVVGPELRAGGDLSAVKVVLQRNDQVIASATGAAASGNPLAGVCWLADELEQTGRAIEPGQIVITGGLTSATAVQPGDEVRAVFDGHVEVRARMRAR